ncbi:MAG TPA: MATE family efflux transporter [Ramlibacter sp.]|nr:MATE family efflux transporter [Ramlibacter sp.]
MNNEQATQPALPSNPPPLWRAFAKFLAPMILANLLQGLSGTVNAFFIGQMLGTRALAAVAGVFPILFVIVSLMIGVGAGASVLIGQAWGAREVHKVKSIAGTAIALGLLLGAVVAIFGGLYTEAMLRLLSTPPDVMEEASRYARVMLLATPGLLVFLLMTQLMRGTGDTVTPLLALMISTTVTCIVTPAFIRGWFGLPQLGVASGAAAAIASFLCALLFLAIYMRIKKHPLAPDAELLRDIRVNPRLLKLVLKIGMPTAVQMIVISLSEVVLLKIINGFGSDATAAYGAVNQVVNYAQFPAISIAITASILGAQAIGAGRTERLGEIVKTGLMLNVVLTGSLVLLGYIFSRHIVALFITSEPVIEMAQTLLHIMLWSIVMFGFAGVLGGIMRASGTVLVPTAISIFCIAVIELPAAYLLSSSFGLNGVWMAYPVTFGSMLVLQAAYYRLVWRKKKIERMI